MRRFEVLLLLSIPFLSTLLEAVRESRWNSSLRLKALDFDAPWEKRRKRRR
jgi:hypothetical protein